MCFVYFTFSGLNSLINKTSDTDHGTFCCLLYIGNHNLWLNLQAPASLLSYLYRRKAGYERTFPVKEKKIKVSSCSLTGCQSCFKNSSHKQMRIGSTYKKILWLPTVHFNRSASWSWLSSQHTRDNWKYENTIFLFTLSIRMVITLQTYTNIFSRMMTEAKYLYVNKSKTWAERNYSHTC
jgi:hypothetical protein